MAAKIKAAAGTLLLISALTGAAGKGAAGPFPLFGETVDGIVAVVDGEIVTLTDLRIVSAFGLYPEAGDQGDSPGLRTVLDRLLDQKLVMKLMGESIPLSGKARDDALTEMIQRLGTDEMRRRLALFDLTEQDLGGYLGEFLLYREAVARRFNRAVLISLQEIEEYYRGQYVPGQERLGLTPRRLTEVLEEIESVLREQRRREQIKEWLRKLRLEAEVQLFIDRYPEFF